MIIIDDGIATGATICAGISAVSVQKPQKIIVAVPVADKNICDELSKTVDEVICLYQPPVLMAVGNWYEDFEQVTDDEVVACMNSLMKR